jgi:Zn-dependent protease
LNLGRIAGIPTRVHASFALLILWALYSSVSGGAGLVGALLSVGFLFAVFASVLLHEFGHALTARRFGIETESITLWPIGGVARLKGTPRSPRAEIWIAAAGPAVNVAIAVIAFALQMIATSIVAPAWVSSLLGGLVYANIALAVFNMLPAFPMDGGRVLRAALAKRRGMLAATEVAAKVGKGFAVVFGVLGLIYNPMLLLIAPFVWFAADRELRSVRRVAAMAAEVLRRRAWHRDPRAGADPIITIAAPSTPGRPFN